MDWIHQQLGGNSIGMLLWAGVGVLTAALLILSRTRWGQARPLSKCIGLSVYAHILFGGYAYVTKYFEPLPPPEPEPVKVTFIEQEPRADDLTTDSDTPSPWERLAVDSPETPSSPEADRVTTEVLQQPAEEFPLTMEPLPQSIAPSPLDIAPPAIVMPRLDVDLPPTEQLKIARSQVEPTPIDIEPTAPVQQRAESGPLRPEAVDMARVRTDFPRPTEPGKPLPQADANLPRDMSAIQRMAEAPIQAAEAEAVFDRIDQLQQTDNREPGNLAATSPRRNAASPANVDGVPPTAVAAGAAIPRRLGDGAILPAPYRNRVEPLKSRALLQNGGDERTEASVKAALRWLAENQSPDGRWSSSIHGGGRESKTLGHDRQGAGSRADTGMTGLAILAFVGAGHSHLEGEHKEVVRKGIEFLLGQQKANGELAGEALLYARMYCHGIAFLALSETYAMSGDHRLKSAVEKAMSFTVGSQHRTTGGWRYQPGDRGDLSQFGWQVMALRSAEHAGLPVPAHTRTRLESFFRSVSGGQHGGLARYRQGERISRTMTAEALACRYFLELDSDDAAVREASRYLIDAPPSDDRPNLYFWYYATLGLFPRQDATWATWNDKLINQLISRQRTTGPMAGSWDTDTVWGSYGGRVYTTALSAMCLEVYYRYQPLIKAEADRRDIRSAERTPWRR